MTRQRFRNLREGNFIYSECYGHRVIDFILEIEHEDNIIYTLPPSYSYLLEVEPQNPVVPSKTVWRNMRGSGGEYEAFTEEDAEKFTRIA